MKIQSLSICVPTEGCVNNCKFCVSRMHNNSYPSVWKGGHAETVKARRNMLNRMLFARDNGCNTMIITGTGEGLQNKNFLLTLDILNQSMPSPFRWIEFQTSGVMLTDENLEFLDQIGVNTISISVACLFNNKTNLEIQGVSPKLNFELEDICKRIKNMGFNLRLSLNMSESNDILPEWIFDRAKSLGADQITFRKLYTSNEDCPQNTWIKEHNIEQDRLLKIEEYIEKVGVELEILPIGATRYSVNEISTVVDKDCMGKELTNTLKYLVLRENAKLYSRWDDRGSLIF